MALWELVNPSDPYTLRCDDFEVAAVVSVLLGEGKTPLHEVGGDARKVPFFLFGGHDEWFLGQFGAKAGDVIARCMTSSRSAIADALDSVVIGTPRDRELYEEALSAMSEADRAAYRKTWHDRKRSSLSDYGSFAWGLAERLRQETAPAEAQRSQ